ncbi:MAG: hypothetical protein A2Z20_02690 [Bdellovibrionales bacterium RBG_16_40_8]|nr:MAG: hypothetical protein A2Z20_02690 [Bdellovibrionales bacterium RBG_16_40_8]
MVERHAPKTNSTSSTNVALNSNICTTPLSDNKAFLIQKYVVEKVSARQIGVLAGCAHSTINDALDRFGITKSKRPSGHIPYGSKMKKCRLVHHTREQNIIQQIWRRKRKGCSNAKIAKSLSNRGIKSPAGNPTWSPATVGRILWRLRYQKQVSS